MFIAALFILTSNWKKTIYLLIGEQMNNSWYIHTVEYYSGIKKMQYLYIIIMDGSAKLDVE